MKKPLLDKPTRYRIELLVILLVISVAGNIGLYYLNQWYYAENFTAQPDTITPSPAVSPETTTMTVLLPGAPPATTEASLTAEKTILDLLREHHAVIASGEADREYVYSIDGISANPARNQFWSFSLNGVPAERNPGSVYPNPDDTVVWELKAF